ncbi:galactitol-1-phosphate 5-dehydrogenase [Olsenella sp. Marseille-P4559]|uniref:galactitol-1-phosphate 5-dehydrogenase n=1 Tax=Olsenella sp. Marseille-P4559 TaxID=2364795 RepID=UPI001A920692|nr:galactitol-1-phosphate 5-dehydrogenase [Olsenella sp. Marseille-P4559]
MGEKMWAGVLHGKDNIRYEEVDKPSPGPNEVLVKVKQTGICGSDVPRVIGDAAHFYPIILGHEFSGVVAGVGENVTSVEVGGNVAGAPLIPCGTCEDCQRGDYSLCNHYSFIGTRQPGSFAEYVVIPENCAVPFDVSVSYEQAALIEPTAVALHGLERLDYHGGGTVAVLGGGTIGIITVQWAKAFGAREVTVFDILPDRLEFARKMGATSTVNSMDGDWKDQVSAITNGRGYDYVVETAGSVATMKMIFDIVANKGQASLIGKINRDITFTPQEWEHLHRREFTLTGSWLSYSAPFPGHEWTLTADAYRSGMMPYDESFIYTRYPLSKISEAFEEFKTPGRVKGKILLDCER